MMAIVCGGRDYDNEARVKLILDAAVERLGLHTIIEGGARGADTLAKEWAVARGDVSWIEVPANWEIGAKAGPARNQMMLAILLREEGDKAVIAFPGGAGTAHMCRIAEKAGIRIIRA
jgi:hypothetical protein